MYAFYVVIHPAVLNPGTLTCYDVSLPDTILEYSGSSLPHLRYLFTLQLAGSPHPSWLGLP